MSNKKYSAFISYRHLEPDMVVAKRLHTAIETYHIPAEIKKQSGRKRMGRVFRDAEELPLSSDLGADIEEALDNSEWFIAVCSPEYQKSKWCMRELEYFVERNGLGHVLAVIVDGEPEASFPEILCYGRDKEGERVRIEPLAADVRDSSLARSLHKLNKEKLRLLAPMLSVSYDDLKRRARQRKIRIALAVASVTLAISASIISFVFSSNRRAEALRQEAEEQRIQAEIERKTAANNSIGELIEKANSYLSENERQKAAASLLEAFEISKVNDDMRHNEIISLLRHVMYISPFTPVSRLVNRNLQLRSIKVTLDKSLVIGIENSNTVVAVDMVTNEVRYRVSVENGKIDYIEFSHDGSRFLAICGDGQFVQIWDAKDGAPAFSYTSIRNTSKQIANAHFWQSADKLLIQDWDTFYLVSESGMKTTFYSMGDQQDGYSYEDNLYTAFAGIHPMLAGRTSVKDYFSPNKNDYMYMDVILSNDMSKVLISGAIGKTGTIVLDDAGNRICLLSGMPGTVQEKYSFSPDAKQVSCLSCNGFLATWDTETGKLLYFYSPIPEAALSDRFSRIAYSPDGNYMAYVYRDELMIWDSHQGEWIGSLILDGGEKTCDSCVSFSPDGRFICAAYENTYFVDARDASPILTIPGDDLLPYDDCVLCRDTILISQRSGGTLQYSLPSISSVSIEDSVDMEIDFGFDLTKASDNCWDNIPEGRHQLSEDLRKSYSQYFDDLSESLYYSNDGKTAALSYPDGTIELFKREGDDDAYNIIRPFYFSATWKTALAISPHYLVAAGGARQMIIYNLEEKTIENSFETKQYHERIVIDKNEHYFLATAPGNYGIDVFSLETGELLLSMAPGMLFLDCGFSADGAYVVGKTETGYVVGDLLFDEQTLQLRARQLIGKH